MIVGWLSVIHDGYIVIQGDFLNYSSPGVLYCVSPQKTRIKIPLNDTWSWQLVNCMSFYFVTLYCMMRKIYRTHSMPFSYKDWDCDGLQCRLPCPFFMLNTLVHEYCCSFFVTIVSNYLPKSKKQQDNPLTDCHLLFLHMLVSHATK